MQTNVQHITQLLLKRFNNELTVTESSELDAWLSLPERSELFEHEMQTDTAMLNMLLQNEADKQEQISEKLLARVKERINEQRESIPKRPVHFLQAAWLRYVAVLLIIAGCAVLYLYNASNSQNKLTQNSLSFQKDILPGADRAILTLSDGRQVALNNATSETITDGRLLIKNNKGQLNYSASLPVPSMGGGGYNTMVTPRGGQYQLTLSDGTRVWLNAASSIIYPIAFTGKIREVSITGEVYFEVTQNIKKPFLVTIEGRPSIEVLGTRFNINAYKDEPVTATTLLEGSIKMGGVILKPGQQVRVTADRKISVESTADIQKIMAWKNGRFDFDGLSIRQAMNQIARWYDIEVQFEGPVETLKLRGGLKRNLTLNDLIVGLEGIGGLHFTMKGKTVIVSK